jgi:hypothetical protein
MSAKDNWDDSSDEEEVDAPPDPLYNAKGGEPLYETNEEYHEVQYTDVPEEPEEDEFVDAKASEEDNTNEERGFTSDEDWGEDDDYEDELDKYDRKLGRYVSCN